MNRLKEKYNKEVKQTLKKEFGIKGDMSVPKLAKVVVNMGVGEAAKNQQTMEALKRDMSQITGQAASVQTQRFP
jgi:large subunit ribosomal protein L5